MMTNSGMIKIPWPNNYDNLGNLIIDGKFDNLMMSKAFPSHIKYFCVNVTSYLVNALNSLYIQNITHINKEMYAEL